MKTETARQTPGYRRMLGVASLLAMISMLSACVSVFAVEAPTPKPSAASPSATPSPSPTFTVTPSPTASPSPTRTPTPLPTLSIPLLTQTPTATHRFESANTYLPGRIVPDPFGVEIHFKRTTEQELDYLAEGGFKWIRMDLFWHQVETEAGRYNFSEYDALVQSMSERDINIIFILDYGNLLYDSGFPPTSPEGRAAFARFAATAAYRYRDAPITIIWDIWNEPNLDHFWTPHANAHDYARLALQTAGAIRRVDPSAVIAGPALAGYEWDFWRTLGEMGVFQRLDAITVHSYGVTSPEALTQPFLTLRALIDSYSPHWKIPILSGEWGFASTEQGYSETKQAQYLVRQWLVNLYHDINVNIWYDWHNDGTDPYNPEHNFGTVRHDYSPKPTYYAAQTLAETLRGYRFLRRIPQARADDYVMLFQRDQDIALAVWTTGPVHTLALPIPTYGVDVVQMTGDRYTLESDEETLNVKIGPSPQYLLFTSDSIASELGGWRPINTINRMVPGKIETLHVVFENRFIGPRFGELQVWVGDDLRGAQAISIPPKTEQQIRLPVDLSQLEGNVPATLRLVPEWDIMSDLQTASIWLQVAGSAE